MPLCAAASTVSTLTCGSPGLTTRSFASVYRVLRRGGALAKRRRRPKPNWTLYAKAWPGERAQIDIQYLPGGHYQLTLIDDCSRLTAATVMSGRPQKDVIAALPRLLATFPFELRFIPDGQRLGVRELQPGSRRGRFVTCASGHGSRI